MDFYEKLKRCAAEVNKAKAGLAAGLKSNTISSYLAKRSIPRADIAHKIARALEVPLEWLLDDKQGWPPPEPGKSINDQLRDIPRGDLLREMARRYRLEMLEFSDALEAVEKEDWAKALASAQRLKPGGKLSTELNRALSKIRAALDGSILGIARYDLQIAVDLLHDDLPGGDRPVEALQFSSLQRRFHELAGTAEVDRFIDWMNKNSELLKSVNADTSTIGLRHVFEMLDDNRRVAMLNEAKRSKNAKS